MEAPLVAAGVRRLAEARRIGGKPDRRSRRSFVTCAREDSASDSGTGRVWKPTNWLPPT